MKFLILGSSGQIGTALTEYVKKNTSHEAIGFDVVRNEKEDLRIPANPLLEESIKNSDFIFFLAFDVGGSRYLKMYQDTYDFITNNQKLMVNTFELIKKHKKPFIFASSQMSTMSFSNYGILKNLGEKITMALGGKIVKFWNVYGLERDLEKSHVITDLILKADQNKKIDLLTDGKESRQLLHAEDCSRCLVTLAEQFDKVNPEQPLHITSFEWTCILDVAQIISEEFNNIPIVPGVASDDVQHSVRNEPSQYIFNFWKPKINIKEGVRDIIKQMRELKMIK